MSNVFITSKSAANRHGVFAIERRPPLVITAIGTGQAAIVGQFPWGPAQKLTAPRSIPDLLDTFAPPGMDRTGSAYLSIIGKGWPRPPRVVRVVGVGAAKATATILDSSDPAEAMLTLTAKHEGAAGNVITATVKAASDGNPNHFDLEVSVAGPSGSTVDTLQNLNFSGIGAGTALTPADFDKLRLLGGVEKIQDGVPEPGTYAFSGGADGTVTASDYVGTAQAGNRGMALLEGDPSVRVFFVDDPGAALRDDVNAGGMAHAILMGSRVFFANGDSGQSVEDVKTDVKKYRSDRVVYCDAWAYQRDDVDMSTRLVPSASFAASVACQLPPSTSIAWKAPEVQEMLSGIVGLEFNRGQAVADLTEAGVCCFIQEEEGGFTIESDTTALGPVDPPKASLRRRRMGDYMAISIAKSARPEVDAPNVPVNQANVMGAVESFLGGLKRARDRDPNHNPHIADYYVADPIASNSKESIAAGEFSVDTEVTISPAMSKIFLNIAFGETIVVTAE